MGIEAGVARVDITPPVGTELCGYGFYLNRRSTDIRDRLYSKALVLSDGVDRVAIVTNDLIGITKETTKSVRNLTTEDTGIPRDHILLSCTHTHHGPATIPSLRACGEVDSDYLNILPKYIAGAIGMANSSLRDARIGAGIGNLDDFSMNRVEKGGLIDPGVGVIRVDDVQDKPIALLANFSCHPVVNPINSVVSSDFPGSATSIIETVKKGVTGMFLQGACGDINPVLTWSGKVEKAGVSLAAETLKVAEQINTTEEITIGSKVANIELPLNAMNTEEVRKILSEHKSKTDSDDRKERQLSRAYYEWAQSLLRKLKDNPKLRLETEIQAVRIGDIILGANPSETFVEFCLEVKEKSPCKKTFLVGCANDFVGYIPDREDFERKGYAADLVPVLTDNFPFTPNIGEFLVGKLLDLIQRLY